MVPSIIYIMSVILGIFLGMSYLGFRYYKGRYKSIKLKYDEVGGDDLVTTKTQIEYLEKELKRIKKENKDLQSKEKIRKQRRGLHKRTVIRTHDQHQILTECEVIEIDRAKGKSKVEVVHINCNETLSDTQRKNICELVNGWIGEKEIEWFEKPLDELRDDKIDDLLDD